MAQDIVLKIKVDGKTGAATIKSFEGQIKHLGKTSHSMFSKIGQSFDTLGGKWATLAGAAGFAELTKEAANFDDKLSDVGRAGNMSAEQMAKLKKVILDTASDPNVHMMPSKLLEGVSKIIEKTGDVNLAINSVHDMGIAGRASGANLSDLGAIVADLNKKMGIPAGPEMLKALNALNEQGKGGALVLPQFASQAERVAAASAQIGLHGADGARVMGAMLTVIRSATGSSDEASTAYENLSRQLIKNADKIEKTLGVKVWANSRKTAIRSIDVLMKDILTAAGGNLDKLTKLFNIRAIRAVNAFEIPFSKTGNFKFFDDLLNKGKGTDQITKDAAAATHKFSAELEGLHAIAFKFADDDLSGPLHALNTVLGEIEKHPVLVDGILSVVGIGVLAGGMKVILGPIGEIAKEFGVGEGGVLGAAQAATKAIKALGGLGKASFSNLLDGTKFVIKVLMDTGKGGVVGAAKAARKALGAINNLKFEGMLGNLSKAAGVMGAIVAAAIAGWEIGKWIGSLHVFGKSINDWVQEGFNKIGMAFGARDMDAMPAGATVADGSHAGGLSYVPFDGYKAVLHQGEAVLTASQNSALHKLTSGPGATLQRVNAEWQNYYRPAPATTQRTVLKGSLAGGKFDSATFGKELDGMFNFLPPASNWGSDGWGATDWGYPDLGGGGGGAGGYLGKIYNSLSANDLAANSLFSVKTSLLAGSDLMGYLKDTSESLTSTYVFNLLTGIKTALGDPILSRLDKISTTVIDQTGKLIGFLGGADGSHASGLDYVPFDGYRAILHRGERVMTAEENSRGAGSMSIGGGIHIHLPAGTPAQTGQDWRRIVREHIIPELSAAYR